jgi:hypothetical protein
MLQYLPIRPRLPFLHPVLSFSLSTLLARLAPGSPYHGQRIASPCQNQSPHTCLPFLLLARPFTHRNQLLYKLMLPTPDIISWITLRAWRWDTQVVLKHWFLTKQWGRVKTPNFLYTSDRHSACRISCDSCVLQELPVKHFAPKNGLRVAHFWCVDFAREFEATRDSYIIWCA